MLPHAIFCIQPIRQSLQRLSHLHCIARPVVHAGKRRVDVRVIERKKGAASSGLSLPIIGKMLGHSQPATTARYAHPAAGPVKAADAATADQLD